MQRRRRASGSALSVPRDGSSSEDAASLGRTGRRGGGEVLPSSPAPRGTPVGSPVGTPSAPASAEGGSESEGKLILERVAAASAAIVQARQLQLSGPATRGIGLPSLLWALLLTLGTLLGIVKFAADSARDVMALGPIYCAVFPCSAPPIRSDAKAEGGPRLALPAALDTQMHAVGESHFLSGSLEAVELLCPITGAVVEHECDRSDRHHALEAPDLFLQQPSRRDVIQTLAQQLQARARRSQVTMLHGDYGYFKTEMILSAVRAPQVADAYAAIHMLRDTILQTHDGHVQDVAARAWATCEGALRSSSAGTRAATCLLVVARVDHDHVPLISALSMAGFAIVLHTQHPDLKLSPQLTPAVRAKLVDVPVPQMPQAEGQYVLMQLAGPSSVASSDADLRQFIVVRCQRRPLCVQIFGIACRGARTKVDGQVIRDIANSLDAAAIMRRKEYVLWMSSPDEQAKSDYALLSAVLNRVPIPPLRGQVRAQRTSPLPLTDFAAWLGVQGGTDARQRLDRMWNLASYEPCETSSDGVDDNACVSLYVPDGASQQVSADIEAAAWSRFISSWLQPGVLDTLVAKGKRTLVGVRLLQAVGAGSRTLQLECQAAVQDITATQSPPNNPSAAPMAALITAGSAMWRVLASVGEQPECCFEADVSCQSTSLCEPLLSVQGLVEAIQANGHTLDSSTYRAAAEWSLLRRRPEAAVTLFSKYNVTQRGHLRADISLYWARAMGLNGEPEAASAMLEKYIFDFGPHSLRCDLFRAADPEGFDKDWAWSDYCHRLLADTALTDDRLAQLKAEAARFRLDAADGGNSIALVRMRTTNELMVYLRSAIARCGAAVGLDPRGKADACVLEALQRDASIFIAYSAALASCGRVVDAAGTLWLAARTLHARGAQGMLSHVLCQVATLLNATAPSTTPMRNAILISCENPGATRPAEIVNQLEVWYGHMDTQPPHSSELHS